MGTLAPILRVYDEIHNITDVSGAHNPLKFGNDLKLITNQLLGKSDVLVYKSNRCHRSFKNVKHSLLNHVSLNELKKWIKEHIIM